MRDSFLARRDLIVGLLNGVPGVTCRNPGGRLLRLAERYGGLRDDCSQDSEEFRKRS